MTTKKREGFFFPLKILSFAEWNFFFESHDVSGFADSNAPTIKTIKTSYHVSACLIPQRIDDFYRRK